MVREYAKTHRHQFGSDMDAFVGGVIAGISGSKGGRISALLAVVDTGSVDRYFAPEEAGMRYCTQPVAVRICGGHSVQHQVFLEEY